MLETFERDFNPHRFLTGLMSRKSLTRTQALQLCRREIPKESYYQDKIRKGIQKRYGMSFVRKIAQGQYSTGGIPDVLCIIDGHYFGFEIKRPLLGEPSKLQLATIREIQAAGGTAAIVTWPEECYQIIDDWRSGREV